MPVVVGVLVLLVLKAAFISDVRGTWYCLLLYLTRIIIRVLAYTQFVCSTLPRHGQLCTRVAARHVAAAAVVYAIYRHTPRAISLATCRRSERACVGHGGEATVNMVPETPQSSSSLYDRHVPP